MLLLYHENKYFLRLAGSVLPVTAYDKNGLRILLHFAKECPPGRPDVLVVVVSMLNTAPLPIKNIVLQAAVPKVRDREDNNGQEPTREECRILLLV